MIIVIRRDLVGNGRYIADTMLENGMIKYFCRILFKIYDWILENRPNCHTRPIPFYWPS